MSATTSASAPRVSRSRKSRSLVGPTLNRRKGASVWVVSRSFAPVDGPVHMFSCAFYSPIILGCMSYGNSEVRSADRG